MTSPFLHMCLISFYLCHLGEGKIMDHSPFPTCECGPQVVGTATCQELCHAEAKPLTCLREIIQCPQVAQSICFCQPSWALLCLLDQERRGRHRGVRGRRANPGHPNLVPRAVVVTYFTPCDPYQTVRALGDMGVRMDLSIAGISKSWHAELK